ncbi:MAG TPA: hypothetical protein VK815_14460 [Candidatus Acidoferrales bacterium]|jgi:hypothetical protein|nr:hypothetical protein [Candidatus Acidoferrales bacterium]
MTPENNQDDIAAIKSQLFALLVALIVISGTLTGFLYTQSSITLKEEGQVQQVSAQLQKQQVAINDFVAKLAVYGDKHPDFTAQVLKKYGIPPASAVPAVAPAPKK